MAALAFSADGQHLIVGGEQVLAVDLRTGTIAPIPAPPPMTAAGPDGAGAAAAPADATLAPVPVRLAAGASGGEFVQLDATRLLIRDARTGAVVQRRELAVGGAVPFQALTLSPDGQRVALGGDGRSFVVDLRDGESVELPRGAQDMVWSRHGERLATMFWNGAAFGSVSTAFVFDQDGDLVEELPVGDMLGMSVDLDFAGQRVWFGDGRGLYVVDLRSGDRRSARQNVTWCRRLGEQLVVTHDGRDLLAWSTGQLAEPTRIHSDAAGRTGPAMRLATVDRARRRLAILTDGGAVVRVFELGW